MMESVDEFTWIGVTISGRTINNLWYADDTVLSTVSSAYRIDCLLYGRLL